MKTVFEKEKKLNEVLEKLNSLELENPSLPEEIENLDQKKKSIRNWKNRFRK